MIGLTACNIHQHLWGICVMYFMENHPYIYEENIKFTFICPLCFPIFQIKCLLLLTNICCTKSSFDVLFSRAQVWVIYTDFLTHQNLSLKASMSTRLLSSLLLKQSGHMIPMRTTDLRVVQNKQIISTYCLYLKLFLIIPVTRHFIHHFRWWQFTADY